MIFSQLNIAKMSSNSELCLQKFIHDHRIQLMAIQESGCWEPTKEFFKDYTIIQNDISGKNNLRGVALIVKNDLLPEPVDIGDTSYLDTVWCQIRVEQKRILVGSIYISPSAGNEAFDKLLKHLNSAQTFKNNNRFNSLLVYGDFNARSLDWGDHHTNNWGKKLYEFTNEEGLTLCSPFDLTFSCMEGGSVIDLLLADGPIIKDIGQHWVEKDCELFTGAPARGHYPVLHSLSKATLHQGARLKCTDWKNADWKNWNDVVEANLWGLQLIPGLMQDGRKLWKEMLNIIHEANQNFIPLKTICIHSKPYWTENLSEYQKQFLLAKRSYQRRSTPHNREQLDEARDRFNRELVFQKNKWVKQRVEKVNVHDSTQFWKKYKGVFGAKSSNYIGNLIASNSCLVTLNESKEKLLYDTFFTGRHLVNLKSDPDHDKVIKHQYNSIMEELKTDILIEDDLNSEITEAEIRHVIETQAVNGKSCDDDKIHPCVLKKLGSTAITTLATLFNWCLRTGNWIWDTSRVTFIRKEGKSTYLKPDSYRPISMASYFGKVLERIIDIRLRNSLQPGKRLDDDQEGFSAGRSTTRYLFRMLANLSEIKKKKLTCIILFIDFQKAFDSVHLPSLITKLSKLGVQGKILKLLHSFLFGRKVKLKVNDFIGASRMCSLFGLPQGSVLSPFLFIVYVADMTDDLPNWLKKWLSCYKFADDGTLLIAHQNMFECYRLMQRLCNELTRWCQKNKLVINCEVNKTEAIILKTGGEPCSDEEQPPQLQINNQYIRYVRNTKVLGVIIDDELNFSYHARQKLQECNKKWGLITKSTNRNHGLNISSLTLLWKTMILTKLMYAAPIWLWKNIDSFKSLWQSAFMKITGAFLYPSRALTEIALHLPPLEVLTEVQTAKFLCKVLSSDDNVTSTLLQIEGSVPELFHHQLLSLKEFIHWKYPEEFGRRTHFVDLLQVKQKGLSLHYTKDEILHYQEHRWKRLLTSQMSVVGSTQTNDKVAQVLEKMQSNNVNFDRNNFLFNHRTTKQEDSHIMDFIHGNSPIFGNCRERMGLGDNSCYFCQNQEDDPLHQLFNCEEVQDSSYSNLLEVIVNPQDYVNEVLLPRDRTVQRRFIERIEFLMEQHQLVYELRDR